MTTFNLVNPDLSVNRSEVMRRAWYLFLKCGYKSVPDGFSKVMKRSWEAAKDQINKTLSDIRTKDVKVSEGCFISDNGGYCTKGT